MKISYNWLKQYINVDLDVAVVGQLLTDCGLEVESIEKHESVKGALKGFVIGEVITKEKHPNADKLSVTTVDIATGTLLHIVCGAPNVAAGQKVVVATIGTKLYSEKGDFEIKEAKIRGELSQGMICAEDEMGLGQSHDGILVLDNSVIVGTKAKDFFNIYTDYFLEIGLTPNRADAASHIGVARDLYAVLNSYQRRNLITEKTAYTFNLPSIEAFKIDDESRKIDVIVEDTNACPHYAGLTISGIAVKDSPEWLKNKLKTIGLNPINNIVDITNFVLHELGQPLHAFDADKVLGNKVMVKKLAAGTKFTTLDGVERTLTEKDLMICNATEPMCIAGVYGGIKSGVSAKTTAIFLESAYFSAVSIRKTSKHHGLKTDASFRFERGTDPNMPIYALKRAALLIKEIAGGKISSQIVEVYPTPCNDFEVSVKYSVVARLIGKSIPTDEIKNIITSLGIKIKSENSEELNLLVPPFKVDVKRDVDVIEEILRVYGYNHIEFPASMKSNLSFSVKPNPERLQNIVSDMLSNIGFNEIWNNSLTNANYVAKLESLKNENDVKLLNPLSEELGVMRQSLLFGGLETILHNQNRKNPDLKLYEFGNIYKCFREKEKTHPLEKFFENKHLALFVTGKKQAEGWDTTDAKADFYYLKNVIINILKRLGINNHSIDLNNLKSDIYDNYLGIVVKSKEPSTIVELGQINTKILKSFDIKDNVYYADINWDLIIALTTQNKVQYKELSKFPEVKRDLALLLDKEITFDQIREAAQKVEKNLLKNINLFDIYEGDKLPKGKKSYAVSIVLQDANATLTDKIIDNTMNQIIKTFKSELNADLR